MNCSSWLSLLLYIGCILFNSKYLAIWSVSLMFVLHNLVNKDLMCNILFAHIKPALSAVYSAHLYHWLSGTSIKSDTIGPKISDLLFKLSNTPLMVWHIRFFWRMCPSSCPIINFNSPSDKLITALRLMRMIGALSVPTLRAFIPLSWLVTYTSGISSTFKEL